MIINLKFQKKFLSIEAKKCGFFQMFRGLMFRRREKAPALLFDFQEPVKLKIHSWFVFFPFLAVWLDDKNKILEIRKIKPFRICVFPKKKFFRLVEIPFNNKYSSFIKRLNSLF